MTETRINIARTAIAMNTRQEETIIVNVLIADVSLSNINTNETFSDWQDMHISNKVVVKIKMSHKDATALRSLPFHHIPTMLFQHPIKEDDDDNEGHLFKITNLFSYNQYSSNDSYKV